MSEQTPVGTVDQSAEATRIHEVAKFLRQYEISLVTLEGDQAGENILITRLPFVIGRGKRATKRLERPWMMAKASRAVEILSTGSTRKPVLNTAWTMPCPVWSR